MWIPVEAEYWNVHVLCMTSLSTCLGFIAKKVIVELHWHQAACRGPLNDWQLSNSKQHLPVDRVAMIVNWVYVVWLNSNRWSVLNLDIEAPFPSVPNQSQVHTLQARHIDGDNIEWAETFTQDYEVDYQIDGKTMMRQPACSADWTWSNVTHIPRKMFASR
jgi:hypothetical protein